MEIKWRIDGEGFGHSNNELGQIIENIKVYQGFPEIIPLGVVEGASETDCQLANAAIDYHLNHPDQKVAVISDDQHLFQILKVYLIRALDVISPNIITRQNDYQSA